MPDYVVTKQIAVTSDSPEEAVAKSGTEGKTISLSANLRPPTAQRPTQTGQTAALAKHVGTPTAQS